jgi:hypothetical protein
MGYAPKEKRAAERFEAAAEAAAHVVLPLPFGR